MPVFEYALHTKIQSFKKVNDKNRLKEIAILKDNTINWNTISKHSSDDQCEIITDPTQIKDYIIQRNVVHLNQA